MATDPDVQVPRNWLDDVLDVLRDDGTYPDLLAEAEQFGGSSKAASDG